MDWLNNWKININLFSKLFNLISFFLWRRLTRWWTRMVGHTNSSCISPPANAMKLCPPGIICIIRCDDINHPNERIVVVTEFGVITSQKSNMALIDAITAHCSLFPIWGVDLLPANMKRHVQLHLLMTASVLNAAMAMIISSTIGTTSPGGWVGSWALVVAMAKETWNESFWWTLLIYPFILTESAQDQKI